MSVGNEVTMKKKSMLDDNNKRREWLEYDSDKNQMHCKDCRMYANGESQKRGPFVIGTQNFMHIGL